jgi:hypothetical protein
MSITPVGSPFTFIVADSRGNTVTACNAGSGYLKTGATGGFLYVPQMSGAPNSTGATGYTGTVAMCFDSRNNMPWYLNPNNTFGGSTGPAQLNWVAGNGQVLIGRIILTSTTGTAGFTGISQSFNHLKIVTVCKTDSGTSDDLYMRMNGDKDSNYSWQNLNVLNTGRFETYSTGNSIIPILLIAYSGGSYPSCGTIDIPRYTNTTIFKLAIGFGGWLTTSGGSNGSLAIRSGTWASESPITSLVFFPDSGSFIAGSTFYLYGVW